MTTEVAVVNLGGHDIEVVPSDGDTPVILKHGQVHRLYIWTEKSLRVAEAVQQANLPSVSVVQERADDE